MERTLAIGALVVLIAGCGGGVEADPEFLDATPDIDGLMGEVTGDAASEGLATSTSGLVADELGTAESHLESIPTYLEQARFAVRGLNGVVRKALTPIVELIKNNPDVADGEKHVWGPEDHGNATYRFTLKKRAAKRFGWLLEGKPKGAADDQYKPVMAGGIVVGAIAHRGRGTVGIDGDAFHAIDSSVPSTGKLLMGFSHGVGAGKSLTYALKDFSPDTTQYQKVSAAFRALRGPLGGTVVRMATYSDISEPRDGTRELVISRVRWLPGIGGRADGVVSEGEVPAGKYLLVNACWSAELQQGFKRVRECTKGQGLASCVEKGQSQGAEAVNCGLGLRQAQPPSEDPGALETETETEEQQEVVPPVSMPDGSDPGV